MAQVCRRLRTITGVGPQTSALLSVLFSRFEFANADALVAYSGLDPRPNDSGTKRGRRSLSKKGPSLLRRQMYLAGFSAARSKALKPLYKDIRAKGFEATEAFVILGRKLLRVAFAIWRGTETFDPDRLAAQKRLEKNIEPQTTAIPYPREALRASAAQRRRPTPHRTPGSRGERRRVLPTAQHNVCKPRLIQCR